MAPSTRVRELLTADDPSFGPAIALYLRSFPDENEREDVEDIRGAIDPLRLSRPDQNRRRHFLVCEADGKVVGMRIHDYYFGVGLGWLVYLAVDESYRKSGIGSHLLRCGYEDCRLDALYCGDRFRGAVLEVERVEDANDRAEEAVREARIAFFLKNGGTKLTGSYVQPALREGGDPVPLNLFLIGHPTEPSQAEKKGVVTDFMLKMWQLDSGDPHVAASLAGIED